MQFKLKIRFGEGEVKENSLGKGKDCDKEVGGDWGVDAKSGGSNRGFRGSSRGPLALRGLDLNPGHNRPFIDWLMS